MLNESVRLTKVTTVIPIKWPISGIKPQTKTTMASGPGYGMPIVKPISKINAAANAAIIAWPPTNDPTLLIIALVSFDTRSRLVAGTNRKLIFITCGRDARK